MVDFGLLSNLVDGRAEGMLQSLKQVQGFGNLPL